MLHYIGLTEPKAPAEPEALTAWHQMLVALLLPSGWQLIPELLLSRCFTKVAQGLWRGELAGAVLHEVETRDASRRSPTEQLLYTFSRAFLTDPRAGLPLDEEARKVYVLFQNQVEQFRRSRGANTMKDYELAKISLAELMQPALERMAQEEPQKLARMLPREELAKVLSPEELAKVLTPEQIANALTPKQLANALTPAQVTEMLEALPPEVREQIKQRLH